ncbi:translation initiation factor eIF-2A [Coniophora puteana RWD-64-598 SS2]|uniref:Eukaryotic translation initiation factor 2A n=1 Tax=Coniophora puteana (strain RWD-64-598) TaxID=741705 RepID=A0A5M3N357_CONPW|nr:translation initiation factor eIF-2A [Coniophora puteana RWD-64-598 SS2]EIW85798.1 translation initiation factor eIF-2A [Coniophora puteana RWD-64-598 SS2]
MSSQFTQQYAFRAQKALGLVGGSPNYTPVEGFTSPDTAARMFTYSPDGRLFAYALPAVVRIFLAEGAVLLHELTVPNAIEISFSPRGTYLSTWERPVKLEDGAQHKNLRVHSTSTGEQLTAFTQKSQDGWELQFTVSESHAVRLVGQEIQVFKPADWSQAVVDKLKVEGASMVSLSPGLNPYVAVFIAEKKGAPARVLIYALTSLSTSPPTCQKNFYKADRAQIKWNALGTQVLVLTQTDVDNSNMSYYGETGMYLLSAAGNFDCRVTLDKDGPIHDVTWSPGSKEFLVVYGYMPAKAVIFDHRVRKIHDFGSAPTNFVAYNPQGRIVALAGFGNLAGKITLYALSTSPNSTPSTICTIDAPNTSVCEWSPCGRFLMTATLSPRLRVDNGIKVWYASGALQYVHLQDELYQASWRPSPALVDAPWSFPVPAPPAPHPSVLSAPGGAVASGPVKKVGAYRPPGARGLATPTIYKREDEGGAARVPTGSPAGSGANTPQRGYSRSPAPPGSGVNGGGYGHGQSNGRRYVPGAPPKGPSVNGGQQGQGQGQGQRGGPDGEGKRKKKEGKKKGGDKGDKAGAVDGGAIVANGSESARPSLDVPRTEVTAPNGATSPAEHDQFGSSAADAPEPDSNAKKIRNLNKKLKAIDDLKEKAKRGERLEATQLKKIEGEESIRKELAGLDITPS